MKVLIFSNAPWTHSAYGQQAGILAKGLASLGHEPVIASFCGLEGAPLRWDGVRVLPCRLPGEDYSARFLAEHAEREHADLVLTLCDIWVLDPVQLQRMPLAHWLPVDCSRLSAADARVLSGGGGVPVAMSRHGERCLRDAGFGPLYVPHSLSPVYEEAADPALVRERGGFAPSTFVVGMNAANVDNFRKGMFEQFEAFARFHRRHPDSRLLMHTVASQAGGLALDAVAEFCGIGGAVSWADPYDMLTGLYAARHVHDWYAAVDLYSACSLGEGFGIPVVEAQASGVPVVVTDASAQPELCGAGWKVRGEPFWNSTHAATWVKPYIGEIDKVYEKAWRLWSAAGGRWQRLQAKAREFARPYAADVVLRDHWVPALEELHRRLHPPVALTRQEEGAPAISVCFASRGRPGSLREAVASLLDQASDPGAIEVLVAVDPDDEASMDAGLPQQASVWVAPQRWGYTGLHHYLNWLAGDLALGEWVMWWNDDMRMLTPGWDKVVRANRPAILWPSANHVPHANIAPVWPRAWSDAMGEVSPVTHMDTWLQRLGEALGRHDRVPIEIIHDRADVTGNHDDQTYAEGRKLLGPEGMAPGFDEAAMAAQVAGAAKQLRQLLYCEPEQVAA